VTATVTAAQIAKPGTVSVNTLNPFSGAGNNGLSNALTFIINPAPNPVPAIASLSPTAAAAGSPSFTLTVNGSNFLLSSDPSGGSQVRWTLGPTQSTLPVVNITASQIQATVDTSLLVNTTTQPVSAVVTVYNPPTPSTSTSSGGGGGTSPGGLPFSITPAGATPATASRAGAAEETPAVSIDGRYVAYTAAQGEHTQVFVRDTCEGAPAGCQPHTSLLSVAADGTAGNDDSHAPSMSSDARYVAFSSASTNLAISAQAGRQIYLRDTCLGASSPSCTPSTQLVSTDAEGALVGTEGILPSVSASGRYIAFLTVTPSHASGASKSAVPSKSAAGSANNSGYRQVFVRDTCLGAASCTPKTTRISLQPDDTSTDAKPAGPALSASSTHVALPGAHTATLFTRSVAVDDRVFLALTGSHP
jgi:Tol biopolymer transport system component